MASPTDKIAELKKAFWDGLRPAADLDLAEWSEEHIRLSQEDSATHGRFRAWPFQVEPMRVISPRHPCERVAIQAGSQMLKTRVMLNFLGYIIDVDPGPTLFVEPRAQDAETLSKDRVSPMLRDTPCLQQKVAVSKSRDSGNTIDHKVFKGGFVSFATATSPSSLSMRPIRYLLLDEVSRREYATSSEGDPVRLAEKRTVTFWNRKIVYSSSPGDEGTCRISDIMRYSDQREWHVPCPFCGCEQILEWNSLVWSSNGRQIPYRDENGQAQKVSVPIHEPKYRCKQCDNLISEHHKPQMNDNGRYIPQNPKGLYPGFRVSQLVSPIRSWGDIAQEWVECQGKPDQLKVFVNTVLAETWKEIGEAPDWEKLYSRREPLPTGAVPQGGLFLTAGVDVQADRIECSLYAWGRDRQRWLVEHTVLMGRPTEEKVWHDLSNWKSQSWQHVGGAYMNIVRLAIDTGHETNRVYQWVRTQGSDVLAVDGRSSIFGSIVGTPTGVDVNIAGRKLKNGVKLWPVDVSKIKHELYGALSLPRPEAGQDYPPGWIHLPESVDPEFLKQLTAEQIITKVVKGYQKREWQKIRERNEALDCGVYARAAAHQAGWDRMTDRQASAMEHNAQRVEAEPTEAAEEPKATHVRAPQPPPRGRGVRFQFGGSS